jgi:glycosyltransferase involved in cell wall biosynthesis
MRIAFFSETHVSEHDGVAVILDRLLRDLYRTGHEVLLVGTHANGTNGAGVPPGIQAALVPSIPLPWYPDLRLAAPISQQVLRAVKGFKPDVIHLVTAYSVGLIGLQAARTLGVPAVATFHAALPDLLPYYGFGWGSDVCWSYLRWFHRKVAFTYCPSQATADRLCEQGFENVRVWSYGVETERFHPGHRSPAIRERHGPPDAVHLLYVGRFAPEKDLPVMFDAYRAVASARPGAVHLVLVGDGVHTGRTLARAPKDTTATGYLEGELLLQAYASADVFVHPSRTETQGNVVLEAMASGLPVVGMREGGVLENVRHEMNGLLCEPGNARSFASAILRLVDDSNLRNRLAANARVWAEGRPWDASLDVLIAGYQEAARKQQ